MASFVRQQAEQSQIRMLMNVVCGVDSVMFRVTAIKYGRLYLVSGRTKKQRDLRFYFLLKVVRDSDTKTV